MTFPTSVSFGILLLCCVTAARADLEPLLARVAAAYGGGPTPAALLEKGTTTSLRRGAGPVERLWAGDADGDRFRIVIAYPGGTEKRTLLGARAWQQDRPATAAFRGAVVLQAARMALPWRLRDAGRALSDQGTAPGPDGRPRRIVAWSPEPGVALTAEIDPESGRILRSVGRLGEGDTRMEFATEYSEFMAGTPHGYAARERHFAMGQYIGETHLTEVSVPAAPGDGLFTP
ncbi:MAG: hypothetical protein JNK22_13220 [Rhodocyclaceae bacterium]|nr:hypothetical protein [Rhodocyclaceae bacterium]